MFAVICALEAELVHLRRLLDEPTQPATAGGRGVELGRLAGRAVLLARCGIGMVSAAAITEAVLGAFRPTVVLNYGCAGAHRRDLLPGDVVVADAVVAYDSVMVAPDGGERYWAMHYLADGEQQQIERLPIEQKLQAELVESAAAALGQLPPWPLELGWPAGHQSRAPRVVTGTVCSANRWNRSHPHIEVLVQRFQSCCEDMEAAAIGLGCASHRVPFLALKDISNNELLETTPVGAFDSVLSEVGRRAALVAVQWICAQPV